MALARRALEVNAVLYFEVERERESAFLRASDGPASSIVPEVRMRAL